ncbi:MAG: hypothetical protein Q7R72_01505 [bacterium]|nr:hypothetical protein [bacterium]
MKKHPFTHATLAALYIVIIVFGINSVTEFVTPRETLLIPITMLSLFVLSTAVMGFLFIYEPFRLFFDNQKQQAVRFFLQTVGFFACFVALFVVIFLYTSFL